MALAVFEMADISKQITMRVRIKGVKRFCYRFQLAMVIFKFGAWVAGMGIEIETKETES